MAFGIDDIIGAGLSIINKFIPDTAAQEKAAADFKMAVFQAQANQQAAQTDIDKAEAASASPFVAGARPFIMWTCGVACAYQWVGIPMLTWFAGVFTAITHIVVPEFPHIDTSDMYTIMTGMLGLGGMRSYDKLKGIDTKSVGSIVGSLFNKGK